ncbi:MAG: hypothetical protein ACNS60_14100 [Candidatus Cyclobacteriaceae bacterium M2_1C_046]
MGKNINERIDEEKLEPYSLDIFRLIKEERSFLIILVVLFAGAAIVAPHPSIAMWFGFALAGYSAIANDSIQTIGTFIASNKERRWYVLWLFMGLIFVATVTYSWVVYDGDVSHQRLQAKGFSTAPESFHFLQLAAPIILLILTRARMPVSTTFLLLSAFSTREDAIFAVFKKSLTGYGLAFVAAIVVWLVVNFFAKKYLKGKPAKFWTPLQWVISGCLWSFWIMQDAANIAIYLPRSLNLEQFLVFTGYIFLGLGLLFFLKGDKIQQIVDEKSGVSDVRAATLVDFVYAAIIYYLKIVSVIPISTTWVFIGLLGGRELAISISKNRKKTKKRSTKKAFKMIGKDVLKALIGLIISLIIAFAANENLRNQLLD